MTDLQLVPPQAGTIWPVWGELGPPAAAALGRYTARHVGDRVAFVANGRVVAGTPRLEGAFSTAVEVPVTDRAAAVSLVDRLRP